MSRSHSVRVSGADCARGRSWCSNRADDETTRIGVPRLFGGGVPVALDPTRLTPPGWEARPPRTNGGAPGAPSRPESLAPPPLPTPPRTAARLSHKRATCARSTPTTRASHLTIVAPSTGLRV